MNNPHNLSTALLFTNGAYDKNCYPLTTMDELQQLTSHEYYQRQLAAYRSGDGEAKKRLAARAPMMLAIFGHHPAGETEERDHTPAPDGAPRALGMGVPRR